MNTRSHRRTAVRILCPARRSIPLATSVTPSDRPTLICLTPVKNEAWILERFLRCASEWADHIVIADQQSDDASRAIAAGFPKVVLIDNNSPAYDEGSRQRLLIDAARKLPSSGRRIFIALDADEMLSANWCDSSEWHSILTAPPGTVVRFEWVNLLPGFETCWIPADDVPFGFVDDGASHRGDAIHSTRVPTRPSSPVLRLRDIRVLHYQYVAWQRMSSKQRWYQCWERVNHPGKRATAIFRQYHGMHARPTEEIHPFQPAWVENYERAGVDMRTVEAEDGTWWDRDIIRLMSEYGPDYFRKQNVWDVDWVRVAKSAGLNGESQRFTDPRTHFERSIHRWLSATQSRASSSTVRWTQRALRLCGW